MHSSIWAFDIGTGSFGVAVRSGIHFKDVRSLLLPDGFASTEDATKRRRMYRTRKAHSAREEWLRKIFEDAGLGDAVLRGRKASRAGEGVRKNWVMRPGDFRLEREFPPRPGEKTRDGAPSDAEGARLCYCGAVLRIRLIRGEALAPWQIFKALHSAIQKRGYDPDLPWKGSERGKREDEAETSRAAHDTDRELAALPEGCRFPCFMEAARMGLWTPAAPAETLVRQSHHHDREKGSTKHIVFSRKSVEAELSALIEQATLQLPALAVHAADLLYGPARQSYASYHPAAVREYEMRTGKRLVRGKSADWEGVLSQKVPTFDNRALSSCSLIPRFHAAKASPRVLKDGSIEPDSLLPAEVSFLMKLKNFRFDIPGQREGRFTCSQIREIFEERRVKVIAKGDAAEFRLTKSTLQKLIQRWGGVDLRKDHDVVESPRLSGRSRFSKPALKIVRKLILSGKSPAVTHAEELGALAGNEDPLKGLVPGDLDFLLRVRSSGGHDATWDDFYLPDESLAFVENSGISSDEKIRVLIGRQSNPVVRHRLETFWRLLRELEELHGKPGHIALEFVREDFMGKKARIELAKFQSDRRKAREEARNNVGPGRDALRYQLMKDQGCQCLYCGRGIGIGDLGNCHVDHIVPEQMGGPGALWNFTLCCRTCNDTKRERTPWQWFHQDKPREWDAYVSRVRSRFLLLRPKKVRLLTEEDAQEQVDRYQTLAETAWIARLARTLVCLHFGWPLNFQGTNLRVVVLPGGLTARMRRKYDLNSLLGQEIAALEQKLKVEGDAKAEVEILKKCRADKRHHALDAMVLSLLPQWSSDPTKRVNAELPPGVHRESLRPVLDQVVPTNLCFEKAALEESIYGQRKSPETGERVVTKRFPLAGLGDTGIKQVFKASTLSTNIAKILDPALKQRIGDFVRDSNPGEEEWKRFCRELRLPSKSGTGPIVKSVRLVVTSDMKEFKDLSKNDKRPSLRKGARHRGSCVYLDGKGKPRVRQVYAFESRAIVLKDLTGKADVAEVLGFYQSGCAVVLTAPVHHPRTPLAAGTFKLNTIRADGFVQLTSAKGVVSEPIGLTKLIQAGFRRK